MTGCGDAGRQDVVPVQAARAASHSECCKAHDGAANPYGGLCAEIYWRYVSFICFIECELLLPNICHHLHFYKMGPTACVDVHVSWSSTNPTVMKSAVLCCGAGQSVRHHMLTKYFHAILAVVLAQFTGLGFLDGMAGVIRLAEASPYTRVSPKAANMAALLELYSEAVTLWLQLGRIHHHFCAYAVAPEGMQQMLES